MYRIVVIILSLALPTFLIAKIQDPLTPRIAMWPESFALKANSIQYIPLAKNLHVKYLSISVIVILREYVDRACTRYRGDN